MGKKQLLLVILGYIFLSSCSFHSTQYELIKSVFFESSGKGRPVPTWNIQTGQNSIDVYVVNVEKEIWFASNNLLLVKFDGWQIYKLDNLMQSYPSISIRYDDNEMTFMSGSRIVGVFYCQDWSKEASKENQLSVFRQKCKNPSDSFENFILLDNEERIVKLVFKFHPGFDQLVLSPIA